MIRTEMYIFCDVEKEGCQGTFGVMDCDEWESISEIQEAAKKEGWIFYKEKDVCPTCKKHMLN